MTAGMRTTEFWAAQLVSLIVLANALFRIGIELDPETSAMIVGGVQAAYVLGRSIVKAFGSRA